MTYARKINHFSSFITGNLTSMKSRIIRILPPVLLDVGLPTLDVYTDISLILGWFIAGHFNYAMAMTAPLMVQFISTAIKWYQIEKPGIKKWSWIFLLLQVWPQLRAVKIIRLLFQNRNNANEKYKKLMVDIGSTEPFLEAYSSVMIMSIIGGHAYFSVYNLDGNVNENTNSTNNNFEAVFNSADKIGDGFMLWTLSWVTSFITASLGITKFLLNGPCPILSDKGLLGGICTWNFVLCFLVVLISIFTKLVFLRCTLDVLAANGHISLASLVFLLHFIPNLAISLVSIFMVTGYDKQFLKILVEFPGLWMMPVVTHLTFGPKRFSYFGSNTIVFDKRKLGFSKLLTVINMIITISSYCIVGCNIRF